MKNVTVNSANNVSRQFVAADNDTTMSVIAHADVRRFFGFGEDVPADNAVEVLKSHVDGIDNGDDSYDLSTTTANFRNAILNAVLADGAEISIDYYAVEDENGNPIRLEEDADDQAAEQAAETRAAAPKAAASEAPAAGEAIHGRITVYTNAGMTETVVEIIDGQTTIQDAIYTDLVQSRSGMDETSISNCMVQLNGDTISPANLATRPLHSGDTLELTPRFAATKGNRN